MNELNYVDYRSWQYCPSLGGRIQLSLGAIAATEVCQERQSKCKQIIVKNMKQCGSGGVGSSRSGTNKKATAST
jgi:hypothetical protein